MKNEEEIIKRHLCDLATRAENGGYYVYSEFLSPAEQALVSDLFRDGKITAYTLEGGYAFAERKLCVFGNEGELGYPPEAPCVWLKIAPREKKFSDSLTHRDFLGSLMGLGIRREVLGDIVVSDNEGYLYLLESMVPYIGESLTAVKHTAVVISEVDALPDVAFSLPDEESFVVAGERLDAFVASIYKLSRSQAAALIEKGLVAVDGKVVEKVSFAPREGAMISVRGYGRFWFESIAGDTRKGKIRILARVY